MDADKWSTLPDDLLVDIFRRLGITAVIRCAGACRPWRHAIINNAPSFRPHPDRFFPDLLVGFLDKNWHWGSGGHLLCRLLYVPASSSSIRLPTTGVCIDGRLYCDPLSSRDGFLLLGELNGTADSLCLFTAHTGVCRVLPAAEFDDRSTRSMYVLATGYDVPKSDDGGETAVWILAVAVGWHWHRDGKPCQIFSSTSGAWEPVKCSANHPEDVAHVLTSTSFHSGWVIDGHGAVSWFVFVNSTKDRTPRECVFSMGLRTGRTWITELPDLSSTIESSTVLAVSEDGRLSVVKMLSSSHQMEVWELVGDGGQWTLRQTIDDVQKLLPNCPSMGHMWLSGFCPRSGYLFGTGGDGRNFLIGVDGSSPRLIGTAESRSSTSWLSYEMDSSTYISSYISKMKYF